MNPDPIRPARQIGIPTNQTSGVDWLNPPANEEGARRYLTILRERALVVVLAVVLAALAAGSYAMAASRNYEATADLRVSPVSNAEPAFSGLGLIRQSNTPERDVETIARVAVSQEVAARAAQRLGGAAVESLLGRVRAAPVAESDLIAITVRDPDPERAADIANAFADAVVAERTSRLHEELDRIIPPLRLSVASLTAEERRSQQSESLPRQLATLEALRRGRDPSVRSEIQASVPGSSSGPGLALSIIAGVIVGFILGLAAAFAIGSLDSRLRREEQIRERFRLPIFARIPHQNTDETTPLTPTSLSTAAQEAYRSLRTLLVTRAGAEAPNVLYISSASPGDGKSTTALNLALSFGDAGKRVLLIEADLRRPSLAKALGLDVRAGLADVLLGKASLDAALLTVPSYGPAVSFLLADPERPQVLEILGVSAVDSLLVDARERFDVIVIDSPPATAVADALPLATKSDAVLLVARLGRTRLPALERLGELLAQHGVTPVGLALNDVDPSDNAGAYGYYTSPTVASVPAAA